MNNKSILELIDLENIQNKQILIKNLLNTIKKEFGVSLAFLEYESIHPVLFFLDHQELASLEYKNAFEKSTKLEVLIDIEPFKPCSFFTQDAIHVKAPILSSDNEFKELIFRFENMDTFQAQKTNITRLITEFGFVLNYVDMKQLKNDAIESLIKETHNLQRTERKYLETASELQVLKHNNSDFGVLEMDLDLNVIYLNPYIQNLLSLSVDDNIVNVLSQEEMHSKNFIQYLKKLSTTKVNSITTISLVNHIGREIYFKVSGVFNKKQNFYLKLFDVTSEIHVTKKYSNLKGKFNQMLKAEIEDTVATVDDVTIETLKFFENKDEDFGNHLERISEYALVIAKDIFNHKNLEEPIDEDYLAFLPRAAALHDIGMLSIKEEILFKESKLSPDEFMAVKNHTVVAANMVDGLLKKYPNSIFLKLLKEITLGHHERYDGTGYPYKLRGKQIPLSARIVALADIFDGLTTDRIYKKGLDLDIARMMLVDYRGKLIDPDLVDIYLRNEDKFIEIFKKYNLG